MSGSFRVGLQFTADAKAAKAEVDALATTVRKAGVEVDAVSSKGTKAKKATDGLGAAAAQADAKFSGLTAEIASLQAMIDTMTAAEVRAVAQMGALTAKVTTLEAAIGRGGRGRGSGGAAGSMGNLVSQFNDLGVMMAAGQNPFQMAIQQGTQITQVIGPMGARGAVTALGGALIGMLNPLNLIVLGTIAASAAFVQWLTAGGEKAQDMEDRLETLNALIRDYKDLANLAGQADLFPDYGAQTAQARALLAVQRDIAQADAQEAMIAAQEQAATAFGDFGGMSSQGAARSEADIQRLTAQYATLTAQIEAANAAGTNPAVLLQMQGELFNTRQKIEALSGYNMKILQLAEQMSVSRDEAAQLVQELLRIGEADGPTAAASAAQSLATHMADATDNFRLGGAEARELGKNLVEVVLSGMRIENLDLASPIAAAAGSAAGLAQQLGISLGLAQSLARMGAASPTTGDVQFDPREPDYNAGAAAASRTAVLMTDLAAGAGTVSPFDPSRRNRAPIDVGGAGAGAGGGGGGGAAAERDAVGELIKRLQEEAAIRAELDPVQQEMLRFREDLAGATAEQRLEVEALIEAEQREADAAEATQERWGYLRDTAYDALLTMAKGGDSASDALRNLGASLAEAAFQAAIMGEGPLGSLFGGTSIFSMIGGALGLGGGIPGKAAGGYITGPGDGTSDSILMYGSSGEMMMNARAVRKNRHVLEAMNANSPIVGYAKGGMIGAGRAAGSVGGSSGQPVIVQMKIDVTGARGNAEIMDMVRSGVEQGMAHYDRQILPASVQRIGADARRIG